MPSTVNAEAVELLTKNIHSLPHDEYGVINMLPFADDSTQIHQLARHTCEAIVNLLETHGLLKPEPTDDDTQQPGPVIGESHIQCRVCSKTLIDVVLIDGQTAVDAGMFISGVASINPECPHPTITPDDMRIHMQREFQKMIAQEEAET